MPQISRVAEMDGKIVGTIMYSKAYVKGKFKEADIFEQCEDEAEIWKFTKQFPYYEPLTLKCQWLYKEKLGRICNVQKNQYTIQFWETQIPAKLKGSFYNGKQKFPIVGDYVTFDYNPKGESRILEVCERKSILKRPFPGDHAVRKVKEQEMLRETFSDIVDLSSRCKFRNCSHESEPGCEVKAAIRSGILSEERLELYKRLGKEGKK